MNSPVLAVLLASLLLVQTAGAPGSKGKAPFISISTTSDYLEEPPRQQQQQQHDPLNVPTTAPEAPHANWGTFTATVDPDLTRGIRVPSSFLSTSHEWTRLTDWGDNLPAFSNVFEHFGPNPILRLGGASQDRLKKVPGRATWNVLHRLHRRANVRYIIGLPLAQKNALELSKQMITDAFTYLRPSAIFSFELGNEPEFWDYTGLGGWTPRGKWVDGFPAYATYFDRLSRILHVHIAQEAVRLGKPSLRRPMMSGPGWGNVNTQNASWTHLMIQRGAPTSGPRYFAEATVHYYPYVDNTTLVAKGLLDQDLQDFGVFKFKYLQRISRAHNLPLRITEANSLYGGGRKGLSETMAGTLWCADALFAFANASAAGFHFHWGHGGLPREGGQPNTGVQTNFDRNLQPYPAIHAPWFGYLFFREATAGGFWTFSDTAFTGVTPSKGNCKANMKAWALLSDGGELRAVILNKDENISCNAKLVVPASYCRSGNLARLLPGAQVMGSVAGITFKGQTSVDGSGDIKGPLQTYTLEPRKLSGGSCSFGFAVPAASGAILKVKRVWLPGVPSMLKSFTNLLKVVPVGLEWRPTATPARASSSLRRATQKLQLLVPWKALGGKKKKGG